MDTNKSIQDDTQSLQMAFIGRTFHLNKISYENQRQI